MPKMRYLLAGLTVLGVGAGCAGRGRQAAAAPIVTIVNATDRALAVTVERVHRAGALPAPSECPAMVRGAESSNNSEDPALSAGTVHRGSWCGARSSRSARPGPPPRALGTVAAGDTLRAALRGLPVDRATVLRATGAGGGAFSVAHARSLDQLHPDSLMWTIR